ncbi:MAG: shikimate kinase [Candidatus Electrothrix sp. Rat3]|nr:shikimate kinase [Candidatus Electrothrix rattekaaiensis]
MRLFIAGVSCVGKSAIGHKLADLLGYCFFDLDDEIESFFSMPIESLQAKHLTMNSYRQEASKALVSILNKEESKNSVIALPPSGLMSYYWRTIKKAEGITVVLNDLAQNILNRITFYDKNSILIQKRLSTADKAYYLKQIKKNITYFKQSYKRADISVDIANLDITESAQKVKIAVEQFDQS